MIKCPKIEVTWCMLKKTSLVAARDVGQHGRGPPEYAAHPEGSSAGWKRFSFQPWLTTWTEWHISYYGCKMRFLLMAQWVQVPNLPTNDTATCGNSRLPSRFMFGVFCTRVWQHNNCYDSFDEIADDSSNLYTHSNRNICRGSHQSYLFWMS